MSFASSRIPNQLASASIGLVIQQDEDAGIVLPLTLVSGDLEPLASIELQQGVWTGFAEISVQGDATTVIEYFNIVEDNEGGATNFSGAYLVGTTLPSTDVLHLNIL